MTRYIILVLIAIMSIASFHYTNAQADTLTVTNLNDIGPGSLRDKIDNVANPGDEIVFAPQLAGGTIFLNSGTIGFSFGLIITGPSDGPITLDATNLDSDPIFNIFGDPSDVVINNMVFANSHIEIDMNVTVEGSALRKTSLGSLEVNNSTFINNSIECIGAPLCTISGAAIFTLSELTINRSTFIGNFLNCPGTCTAFGGAVMHQGNLPLILSNSTFYGNEVRCTGEVCTAGGGALLIFSDNTSTLNNNTFSENDSMCNGEFCSEDGRSIAVVGSGSTEMLNTIVSISEDSLALNCVGSIIDGGNNLQFPDSTCGDTIPVADPMLGPPADNGGITMTQAITQGSPAFNAGNNDTCLQIDQRGVDRPQALICDIGAFELIVGTIPTLSEWGLIATAGLLGFIGFMVIRRRKAAA